MSTESIIGIVSGLFGIVSGILLIIQGTLWLRKRFKVIPLELFAQLMDKKTDDSERRKILNKLNDTPLLNNRIKEDYIKNFALDRRGKEAVLFDICDNNDIEPTTEFCEKLIGVNMPSLKTKFNEKRQKQREPTAETSEQTNKAKDAEEKLGNTKEQIVYLSELLKTKYPETCDRLTKILESHHVKYAFIEGTKDIWCRDYMPIQTESGKFIQFKYDPSYLKGNKEWEESRSDVKEVCRLNGIVAQPSNINIDGGNVLICDDRAIISDRVFSENPTWNKEELVNELSRLLECEIIIIPAENDDMTGHADGMVRFVNRNTILGNKLADEYKYWREKIQKIIDKNGWNYIDVPFFEPKDPQHPLSAVGIYVNYLEVNNLIVLPVFGRDEDKQAIDIIQNAFPDRIIETINYNDVAQEGGLLNCTTWVVR